MTNYSILDLYYLQVSYDHCLTCGALGVQMMVLVVLCGVLTAQAQTDEDLRRPYKFGFTIENQHRREEKGNNRGTLVLLICAQQLCTMYWGEFTLEILNRALINSAIVIIIYF